jgi:hypothetical protein
MDRHDAQYVHVLFVHKNFPAQFGHIASHLVQERGWECTFVSERPSRELGGVRTIQYSPRGGATKGTHYASRTFENAVWHSAGVYDALKAVRSMLDPDLIVGHSGFGSTLFLRELFPDAPVILACLGDATLESANAVAARRKPRKIKLGTALFHGRGGRSLPFRIQLSKANIKLIKRLGKLKVRLIVRASDAAGNTLTTRTVFTLRAPAKRRR